MNNWSDISTAPRDGTKILVVSKYSDGLEVEVLHYVGDCEFCWETCDGSGINKDVPIMWMPLPELPVL